MIQQAKLPTSQPASCGYWPGIFYLSARFLCGYWPRTSHFQSASTCGVWKSSRWQSEFLAPWCSQGTPRGCSWLPTSTCLWLLQPFEEWAKEWRHISIIYPCVCHSASQILKNCFQLQNYSKQTICEMIEILIISHQIPRTILLFEKQRQWPSLCSRWGGQAAGSHEEHPRPPAFHAVAGTLLPDLVLNSAPATSQAAGRTEADSHLKSVKCNREITKRPKTQNPVSSMW